MAYDLVWNAIAEIVEPVYQISISDRLTQTALEIHAQHRYGNLIQPIPQFGGWGWASAN